MVELDLEAPKTGEVLVEIMATGICHTDAYPLDGLDSEGIFPSVLGHEGAGIVREVWAGVTSVKPGDHVIPLYTPECRQCKSCLSGKTNLCTAIRATQGKGLMPDGTTRFSFKGQPIYHYMGRSEEHTSELQSLMRTSYAVFCLKKKKETIHHSQQTPSQTPSTTRTPNHLCED